LGTSQRRADDQAGWRATLAEALRQLPVQPGGRVPRDPSGSRRPHVDRPHCESGSAALPSRNRRGLRPSDWDFRDTQCGSGTVTSRHTVRKPAAVARNAKSSDLSSTLDRTVESRKPLFFNIGQPFSGYAKCECGLFLIPCRHWTWLTPRRFGAPRLHPKL
jgi:hypothetical protein